MGSATLSEAASSSLGSANRDFIVRARCTPVALVASGCRETPPQTTSPQPSSTALRATGTCGSRPEVEVDTLCGPAVACGADKTPVALRDPEGGGPAGSSVLDDPARGRRPARRRRRTGRAVLRLGQPLRPLGYLREARAERAGPRGAPDPRARAARRPRPGRLARAEGGAGSIRLHGDARQLQRASPARRQGAGSTANSRHGRPNLALWRPCHCRNPTPANRQRPRSRRPPTPRPSARTERTLPRSPTRKNRTKRRRATPRLATRAPPTQRAKTPSRGRRSTRSVRVPR